MFSKRTIAMLIAGSFMAAQAGAHSYLSHAQPGQEYEALSEMSEDSFPHTLTVFNPDGTSYTLVTQAYDIILEPTLVVMADEPLPDQLTVFDPDGSVTSYRFTPVDDVAYIEPQLSPTGTMIVAEGESPVILVEVAEPIIVSVTEGDLVAFDDSQTGYDYVVWFDEDGAPWSFPSHMAAFDAALAYTG